MNSHKLIFSTLLLTLSLANASSADIEVALSPAGHFTAQTQKVQGSAYKTADGVAAENITVDIGSLSTGIGLRDKHLKERLEYKKFPQAKLVKAIGKNGQGKANLQVKGKSVQVSGTYTVSGNTLKAEFPMSLSALEIKDVKYMGIGAKDQIIVKISVPLAAKK